MGWPASSHPAPLVEGDIHVWVADLCHGRESFGENRAQDYPIDHPAAGVALPVESHRSLSLVLAEDAQEALFYKRILPELKANGKTVVVISHDDRYYHLRDRVVKLEYGKLAVDSANQSVAATSNGS